MPGAAAYEQTDNGTRDRRYLCQTNYSNEFEQAMECSLKKQGNA